MLYKHRHKGVTSRRKSESLEPLRSVARLPSHPIPAEQAGLSAGPQKAGCSEAAHTTNDARHLIQIQFTVVKPVVWKLLVCTRRDNAERHLVVLVGVSWSQEARSCRRERNHSNVLCRLANPKDRPTQVPSEPLTTASPTTRGPIQVTINSDVKQIVPE
jgi:hypothetical protein